VSISILPWHLGVFKLTHEIKICNQYW